MATDRTPWLDSSSATSGSISYRAPPSTKVNTSVCYCPKHERCFLTITLWGSSPSFSPEYGTAKPDLRLVDRELGLWWVVEVELAHHSLKGHVLPQVEILTSGHYGASEAELLTQSIPELDSEAASDLVKGSAASARNRQPSAAGMARGHRPARCLAYDC